MKIYLVSADGRVSNIAMEYALALEKVVSGQAEEVYADPRDVRSFKGIRLIDRTSPARPAFHRPSLETSNTAITHDTSIKNAGYFFIEGPLQRECIDAHEMVEAWPDEYDRNAVVISAGKVRGATFAAVIA